MKPARTVIGIFGVMACFENEWTEEIGALHPRTMHPHVIIVPT